MAIFKIQCVYEHSFQRRKGKSCCTTAKLRSPNWFKKRMVNTFRKIYAENRPQSFCSPPPLSNFKTASDKIDKKILSQGCSNRKNDPFDCTTEVFSSWQKTKTPFITVWCIEGGKVPNIFNLKYFIRLTDVSY